MRKTIVMMGAALLLSVAGCGLLDSVTSRPTDPKTGLPTGGPSPIEQVGMIWGPLGGFAASVLANGYQAIRSRRLAVGVKAATAIINDFNTLAPEDKDRVARTLDFHGIAHSIQRKA